MTQAWPRIIYGILAMLVGVAAYGFGHGAADEVFARGWDLLPGHERQHEWTDCYRAADPQVAMNACTRRANDTQETPHDRALAFVRLGKLIDDDPAASINRYDQAIAIDQSCTCAYNMKAEALLAYGQTDEAEENLNHALAINHEDISARYLRAVVWFQRGDYRSAAERFSDVITDLPPEGVRIERHRADDPKHLRTIVPFDIVLDDPKAEASILVWRVAALFAAGDVIEARRVNDRAHGLDPDVDLDLAYWCDRYGFRSVNWSATRAMCNAAIAFAPQQPASRVALGLSALRQGDNQAALEAFDEVVRTTHEPRVYNIDISTPAGLAQAEQIQPETGDHAHALYGRGLARHRLHDPRGDADMLEASREDASVAQYFSNAGLTA